MAISPLSSYRDRDPPTSPRPWNPMCFQFTKIVAQLVLFSLVGMALTKGEPQPIVRLANPGFICAGTMLSVSYGLTAAACLINSSSTVVMLPFSMETRRIVSYAVHKELKLGGRYYENNIGVFKVDFPFASKEIRKVNINFAAPSSDFYWLCPTEQRGCHQLQFDRCTFEANSRCDKDVPLDVQNMNIGLPIFKTLTPEIEVVGILSQTWPFTTTIYLMPNRFCKFLNEKTNGTFKCSGTAYDNLPQRVIGGQETSVGHSPEHVFLIFRKPSSKNPNYCSGMMLTHEFVMTSCHCLGEDIEGLKIEVFANAVSPKSPAYLSRVADIGSLSYTETCNLNVANRRTTNDIAIFKVTNPFPNRGYKIAPSSIPKADTMLPRGYEICAAGTSEGNVIGTVKCFESMLDDEATCKKVSSDFDASKRFCDTKVDIARVNYGDSGAAVVTTFKNKRYVYGMVTQSVAVATDDGGYTVVADEYIRLSHYCDIIAKWTQYTFKCTEITEAKPYDHGGELKLA